MLVGYTPFSTTAPDLTRDSSSSGNGNGGAHSPGAHGHGHGHEYGDAARIAVFRKILYYESGRIPLPLPADLALGRSTVTGIGTGTGAGAGGGGGYGGSSSSIGGSVVVSDLLHRLLEPDPKGRLGAAGVRDHEWFKVGADT
jgi:serine/threonine protein kinase